MDTHKDLPIVTIITIVSNNVKTIRNAIQSVAFQDYKKIEHIVIDNCSTDGTLEAIEEQKDFISKIKILPPACDEPPIGLPVCEEPPIGRPVCEEPPGWRPVCEDPPG